MSFYYSVGNQVLPRPRMPSSLSSVSDVSVSTGPYARRGPLASYKPAMSIELDNHFTSKIYTSSSPISGHVTIAPSRDARFDSLQIVLIGMTKTRVEGLSAPHATCHTFLKLNMPIPESTYPVPRVYEAGRTYTVPFNFVIPSYLTINACNHDAGLVADHHTCLPPTMGMGLWEKDDFTPEMSRVEYTIKARVFRDHEIANEKVKVMEATQPILVLPAFTEEPPLSIGKADKIYKLSKSKTIRKSLLGSKLGKLTVSASQPRAVMMKADGRQSSGASALVDVNFEPVSADALPPKITGVSSKITAITYYSSGGINQYPNLGDWNVNFGADNRGSYSSTTPLSIASASNASWRQQLTAAARRDSGYGSDAGHGSESEGSNEGPSGRRSSNPILKTKKGKRTSPVYHSARLQVPIDLPSGKKVFIPTFHSCITSRIYVLQVTVSFGAGASSTSTTLSLPLQIGVETSDLHPYEDGLPSFEAALEEAEADRFLRPRVLSIPDEQYQQGSSLPSYGDLMPSRVVLATN